MVAKFETRAEAMKVAEKLDSGIYELRYGEYERPTYKVRKIRGGRLRNPSDILFIRTHSTQRATDF